MRRSTRPLRCQTCRLASEAGADGCRFEHGRAAAGVVLIEQGTTPDRVIYLRRGLAVLSSESEVGSEVPCAVRGSETMLGLEGALGRSVPYEVRSLTDVALCSLKTESFKEWLGPLDSPLGAALRLSVEEAMRRAGERQAIRGTAIQRVARFLLETRVQRSGSSDDVPLGVLARCLGMRPETLSRALSELRAIGALALEREIRIADPETLRRAAE